MLKQSYIKKEKGKYCVKSENNPKWSGGCYETKSEAKERLKQIEAIKHAKKSDDGNTSMCKQLSDIAKYLEEAGFIADAKQIKDISYVLDTKSDNDSFYIHDDTDNAADFIPDMQQNTENQGYVGGNGTGGSYTMFSFPQPSVAYNMYVLVKTANLLDKRGLYKLADDLDLILIEILNEEVDHAIDYYNNTDMALDGVGALVGANGLLDSSTHGGQNAGSMALSDAYFYRSLGDLEGPPSPSASAPGAV